MRSHYLLCALADKPDYDGIVSAPFKHVGYHNAQLVIMNGGALPRTSPDWISL